MPEIKAVKELIRETERMNCEAHRLGEAGHIAEAIKIMRENADRLETIYKKLTDMSYEDCIPQAS